MPTDLELADEVSQTLGDIDAEKNFDLADRVLAMPLEGPASIEIEDPSPGTYGFRRLEAQPLEAPPLSDVGLRFDIFAGGNAKEKVLAFKKRFPDGDLVIAPSGDLFFQETAEGDFRPVDAPGFWKGGGMEAVRDVVDFFAADIGAITGETLSTLGVKTARKAIGATPQGRGASLLNLLARIATGAFAGQMAQEGVQSLRGLQAEALPEQLKRGGIQGIIGAGGAVVMEPVVRLGANLVSGRGLFRTRTGATEAMAAAKRLGIGDLPVNSVIDNKLIQRLAGQAAAIGNTLPRYIEAQEIATRMALQTVAKKTKEGIRPTTAILESTFSRAQRDILNLVRRQATRGDVKLSGKQLGTTKTGLDLQAAIARADYRAQGAVDLAFDNARAIETPKFDLTDLNNAAASIRFGRRVSTVTEAGAVGSERVGPIPKDVNGVLELIAKLDPELRPVQQVLPNGQTVMITGTDQLRNLRQEIFDLKQIVPQTTEQRRSVKMAKTLWGALTDTLNHPTNGNKKFVGLWTQASTMARKRFEVQETAIMVLAAKSEHPAQLALRVGNISGEGGAQAATNLRVLRENLHPRDFERIQDAVIADLLREPFNITRNLRTANKQALFQVGTPRDITILRKIGADMDKLSVVGFSDVIKTQDQLGQAVAGLVDTNNTVAITQLKGIVNRFGGQNGQFGRFIRAGIMDNLVTAIRFKEGTERISFEAYLTLIDKFKRSGAMDMLLPDERLFIEDVKRVGDLFREISGFGESLMAAQAARGIAGSIFNPKGASVFFITLLENIGFGRLMTNNLGRRIMVGTGKKQFDKTVWLRLFSVVTAQTLTDADAVLPTASDVLTFIGNAPRGALSFLVEKPEEAKTAN